MTDLSNVGQNVILAPDIPYSNFPGYASVSNPYTGMVYAFYGSGGFTIDQCFNTIHLIPESKIYQYDVTNAVQVLFDVRTFNEKLGLFKDQNNQYITFSSYDTVRDVFTTATEYNEGNVATSSVLDSITLSADEFVNGLLANYVMSVGSYNTLYMDFIQYVNTYFGYAGGFGSLFSGASEFNLNGGVFDANAFINIINPYYTASGENVKPLTGTITLTNINSLLKYAINTNCFNNRNPVTDISSSDPGTTNASRYPGLKDGSSYSLPSSYQVTTDPSYQADWGMADGFVAGDLIFVPAGTTVSLHVVLDTELFAPLNNIGPVNLGFNADGTIRVGSLTYATNQQTALVTTNPYYNVALGQFTTDSSATTLNIDRTLTAPLMIKLANLSTESGVGGFKNVFSPDVASYHNDNYYDANNPAYSTLEAAQSAAATRNANALNNWNNSQTNFGPSS
jgi:hypothetical protein